MRRQPCAPPEHSSMNINRICTVVAAALAGTLVSASAAGAFVIGPGARPGLGVDAAGTAYIVWDGPEANDSSLRFCRLPRGATACEAGPAATLPAPATTTAGGRPFVVVSGDRISVVQYRYPTTGSVPAAVYRFTSTNRGDAFDAPVVVGSVAFDQAAAGPGDTLSGVPVDGSMSFQNVTLSGTAPVNPDGSSAVPAAELSTTHRNYASVGLIDAATPLAMFTNGDDAQFRRYNGGDLNTIASWGPAVGIGFASYPRLAGGPTGLFLLAGDPSGVLVARRWDGTSFGPPAAIGPGSSPYKHLFQDAAGRLHAVFQRDSADPLQIVHAVSDDGRTWRSGTAVRQDIATAGGITDLRVATAPDHVGVMVWHAGVVAGGDVRVAAVGPDAPVVAAPPVSPKPKLVASGSVRRVGTRYVGRLTGRLTRPAGVPASAGCKGRVKLSVKRGPVTIASKTVSVRRTCAFTFSISLTSMKVKRARKLPIRLRFGGNTVLAPISKVGSLQVKR